MFTLPNAQRPASKRMSDDKAAWRVMGNSYEPIKNESPMMSPRLPTSLTTRTTMRNYTDKLPSIEFKSKFKSATLQNADLKQFSMHQKISVSLTEPTKCSTKRNGIVRGYAAHTTQGLVRNYNEDRVSIVLNIAKPSTKNVQTWPKCSFFGVYDGHGGSNCADFLRDNLHHYVIKDPAFPAKPKEAIRNGFMQAENTFLENAQKEGLDRSGSCATVVLIVGESCFVANVGDSRAIMSGERGARIFTLSKDHKPSEESEQARILQAGGRIYQSQGTQAASGSPYKVEYMGPVRVFPGRLSVSRTFGDAEAKLPQLGGNPNVVVATPDIKFFRLLPEYDFIVLGCDGIFDRLSNREVISSIWSAIDESTPQNIHNACGAGVEGVIKSALAHKSLDNLTSVVIALPGFKSHLRDLSRKRMNPSAPV